MSQPEHLADTSARTRYLVLEDVSLESLPWPHFTVGTVLEQQLADEILGWLEGETGWIEHNRDFYRSHNIHLSQEAVPPNLRRFFCSAELGALKDRVEELFGHPLAKRWHASINRHLPGEGTLIHTDWCGPGSRDEFFFTHRFLIYLNRGWAETNGGILGLFDGPNSADVRRRIMPVHNSGVGMVIGRNSFHAVSAIRASARYTLNFCFVSATGDYQVTVER